MEGAMAKKQKAEKKKWKFFWKNVTGLGRLLRLGAGAALVYAGQQAEDENQKMMMTGFGAYLIVFGGLLGWCSLRALLHKPTKRARLRHYPEGE
jgi:Protein of unknown function (DUF2892)